MSNETHQVSITYTTEYASYPCGSLFVILHIEHSDQLGHWLMVEISVL